MHYSDRSLLQSAGASNINGTIVNRCTTPAVRQSNINIIRYRPGNSRIAWNTVNNYCQPIRHQYSTLLKTYTASGENYYLKLETPLLADISGIKQVYYLWQTETSIERSVLQLSVRRMRRKQELNVKCIYTGSDFNSTCSQLSYIYG